MDTTKMTVVFDVKDRAAVGELYEAHKGRGTVCGMCPVVLAWGDQVTAPGQITERVAELDPEFIDKKEVRSLIELAEQHAKPTATTQTK